MVAVYARAETQPDVVAAGPLLHGPAIIEQVRIGGEAAGFTLRIWPLIFWGTIPAQELADASGFVRAGEPVLRVSGDVADRAPVQGTSLSTWGGAWRPRRRVERATWAPGFVARDLPVPGPVGVAVYFVVRYEVAM